MRSQTRRNLVTLLRSLRGHRLATLQARADLRRIMDNEAMQDEFRRRLVERFGVNVDNLRKLLELFVEFAPQVLKIVADVVGMFR